MTKEMQESLARELEGAMNWSDEETRSERIMRAQANILISLIDCQRKTADRVKKLSWKFTMAMVALGGAGGTVASKWDVISKIVFGQ